MNSIIVTPHRSIGPLQLGMNQEQILAAIQQLNDELQFPGSKEISVTNDICEEGANIRYMNDFFFFMVQYQNNLAVEIAVDYLLRDHIPIMLYDIDFFKTPAEEVVTVLKKLSSYTCDYPEDEQLSTSYEFQELGLRLWRDNAFHPKLLNDAEYMEKMKLVIEEMYHFLYFELIAIQI